MQFLIHYTLLIILLASSPIYSMEIMDREKDEFPSLFTLCFKKVIEIAKDDEWHKSITTTLPDELKEKLKNHLQDKFNPIITEAISAYYKDKKIKRSKMTFDPESAPPLNECQNKSISCSCSTGIYGGCFYDTDKLVFINNKFGRTIASIRNYVRNYLGPKSFCIDSNDQLIQRATGVTQITQYTVDLKKFNFVIERSDDMPLDDLLPLYSAISDEETQIITKKFLTQYEKMYSTQKRKQTIALNKQSKKQKRN